MSLLAGNPALPRPCLAPIHTPSVEYEFHTLPNPKGLLTPPPPPRKRDSPHTPLGIFFQNLPYDNILSEIFISEYRYIPELFIRTFTYIFLISEKFSYSRLLTALMPLIENHPLIVIKCEICYLPFFRDDDLEERGTMEDRATSGQV